MPHNDSSNTPTTRSSICYYSLFLTSLLGFFSGLCLGYLHMTGWIQTADEGLRLYGYAFGISAAFSLFLAIRRSRKLLAQSPLKQTH
jgi:hypothetical protein